MQRLLNLRSHENKSRVNTESCRKSLDRKNKTVHNAYQEVLENGPLKEPSSVKLNAKSKLDSLFHYNVRGQPGPFQNYFRDLN